MSKRRDTHCRASSTLQVLSPFYLALFFRSLMLKPSLFCAIEDEICCEFARLQKCQGERSNFLLALHHYHSFSSMAGFEDDGADDAFMASLFDELDRKTAEEEEDSNKKSKNIAATSAFKPKSIKATSSNPRSSSHSSIHVKSSSIKSQQQPQSAFQSRPSSSCNQQLSTPRHSSTPTSRSTASNEDQLAAQQFVMMDHDFNLQDDLDLDLDIDIQKLNPIKPKPKPTRLQSLPTPARHPSINANLNAIPESRVRLDPVEVKKERQRDEMRGKRKEKQKAYLGWRLDDMSAEVSTLSQTRANNVVDGCSINGYIMALEGLMGKIIGKERWQKDTPQSCISSLSPISI